METGGVMNTKQLVLILLPLIIINYTFVVLALIDISKRKKVAGGRKVVWALVVLFVSFLGWISYFLLGRKEE
jgi:hypothetical protein